MANNEDNSGMNISDIGTIRDILMGKQINDFENRFKQLHDQVEEMRKNLEARLDSMDASNQEAHDNLAKDTNMKFEELEKVLVNNVAKLENRMDKLSKDDKMRLGKMLDKVSKQLMGD